jgi:two-component system, chemotaxis family, protein-glutamate methylesterase/glutaminase
MTIKLLIVEDSIIVTTILKKIFNSAPDIEVVGTAANGVEGLALVEKLQPNVVCTDLHMPKMNGLELTSEIMNRFPRPILVISASVQEDDTRHVFDLFEAGAVDVIPKPKAGTPLDYEAMKELLLSKVRVVAGVKVFTRKKSRFQPSANPGVTTPPKPVVTPEFSGKSATKIVVIGASTGGPQALQAILSQIKANFPYPIICVQHISVGFLNGLLDWLGTSCALPIKTAVQGEIPQPGVIYFPPENQHLQINSMGRFLCTNLPPVDGHRPSVTVTFQSVAQYYRSNAIGILLTGMGRDGASGLLTLSQAGAFTIAEAESTAVVFGMPKEAIALGAAKKVLPLQDIATTLIKNL